ncbi:MAG: hypothetical protein LBV36_00330 [Chromatiales bacterium]|nr:hypothetical protein [Chromatiales bacterium]
MRNVGYLNATYDFSPSIKGNFTGVAWYDMAYDLFDYDTIAARLARNSDQPLAFLFNLGKDRDSMGMEVRELYVDFLFDNLDIRVGRQFVVWGVLEGVRIVDEVNPVDFRELIMPDLIDYRIPLWTAKFEYFRGDDTWQLLWIPDLHFHKPAPPGSEWELLQRVPGTTEPDSFTLKNSEIGLRYSTYIWNTDVTLSYFYTWDDFPTVFRSLLLNQNEADNPKFLATYTRMNMYGGTFSRQVGDMIVKGEGTYVTGKYFAVIDVDRNRDGFLDNLGEVQSDHIRWGLGLEFNWAGFDIAPGITQWIILDYDIAMVQSRFDNSINLFIRKDFAQSGILFEILAIRFVNQRETYLNPAWTFRLTDHFNVTLGANFFSGASSQFGVLSNQIGQPTVLDQRSQFVGNFHDNDRVYINFKYMF